VTTLGVLMKSIYQNKTGHFTFFAVFQRAVEGTEGKRGDRALLRRQRAIERTEGLRGDRGP
jgi:hypothetical protein